jgi:hypothetical protein
MRFFINQDGAYILTDEVEEIKIQHDFRNKELTSTNEVSIAIKLRNDEERKIILGCDMDYSDSAIKNQCELAMYYIIQEFELGRQVIRLVDGCEFREDGNGFIKVVEPIPF